MSKSQLWNDSRKVDPNDVSIANLPAGFIIEDVEAYGKEFRENFLRWTRERRGMDLVEAAKQIGIDQRKLEAIENGKVTEKDLMFLSRIAQVYEIDYPRLLFVFGLTKQRNWLQAEKLAAYHDQQIDEKTEKELLEFIARISEE